MKRAALLVCTTFAVAACPPKEAPEQSKADPTLVAAANPPAGGGNSQPTGAAQASPGVDVQAETSEWTPRTPEEIRRDGNHLKDAGSVYLRQHAFNPIEWYSWGQTALRRARLEDKRRKQLPPGP